MDVRRRQLALYSACAAATAAAAAKAAAQASAPSSAPPPPPDAFGDLHAKAVDGLVGLAGRGELAPASADGLRKLLGYLVEYKVLSRGEADQIDAAIAELQQVLQKKKPLEAAMDRIGAIARDMARTAGSVARGIVSIISSSVEYAVKLGSRLTDGDKANIVLKDVYGCLAGAAAALLAGQPQFVPLAVLFTAGGMSASALGDALAAKK